MYNGFSSQDAFHQWMREQWAEMLNTPEKAEAHNNAYRLGHAGCDHTNDYCTQR